MTPLNHFLLGSIAALSLVASVFFFRFWRQTHDKLFLTFALSFLLEAFNRTALAYMAAQGEMEPGVYVLRLIGYVLILAGIAGKNLRPPS